MTYIDDEFTRRSYRNDRMIKKRTNKNFFSYVFLFFIEIVIVLI